jgi:hypothetical protein
MTAFFHILSSTSFTNFPLQHYIDNNENLADRMDMDSDRLWEVKGF